MRWRWLAPLLTLLLTTPAVGASAPSTKIGLLDRVIAVVDHTPILLSELRARSRPYVAQLLGAAGPKSGPERVAAEAKVHREMLGTMIDELLFADEALRSSITATPADVDAALQSVATAQGLTPAKLLEAAATAGYSEKEYRDELRRQILEGKVVQLRVRPRIKGYSSLSDAARVQRLDEERRKWLEEQRAAHFIEVRL